MNQKKRFEAEKRKPPTDNSESLERSFLWNLKMSSENVESKTVNIGRLKSSDKGKDAINDANSSSIRNTGNNNSNSGETSRIPSEGKKKPGLTYTMINLSKEDDEELKSQILSNPIQGFFYYEKLGEQLNHLISKFATKDSRYLFPYSQYKHYLSFQSFEDFLKEYRLVEHDRKTLLKILSTLNIVSLSTMVVKYRRFIIKILNSLYIGYTRGPKEMDDQLSDELLEYSLRSSKNKQYVNIQYFNILCKEFREFFDFDTGFGNTMDHFIEEDDIFILNNDKILNKSEKEKNKLKNNLIKWDTKELNVFYESLARLSIHRIEEISDLLPNKSTTDILNLYTLLKNKLRQYKNDRNLRKKLLTFTDFPIAYEMSANYIKFEEEFSKYIENLEENQNLMKKEEYKKLISKNLVKDIKEIFNQAHLNSFLKLLGDQNSFLAQIDETAMFDVYFLMIDYIYELLYKLYRKKLTELSVGQEYELETSLKSMQSKFDNKQMINIIDLKNIEANKHISIMRYKNGDNSSTDGNELDYLPFKFEKEVGFLKADSFEIADKYDIWKLGVTKQDVEAVGGSLLKERKCNLQLWNKLNDKDNEYFERKLRIKRERQREVRAAKRRRVDELHGGGNEDIPDSSSGDASIGTKTLNSFGDQMLDGQGAMGQTRDFSNQIGNNDCISNNVVDSDADSDSDAENSDQDDSEEMDSQDSENLSFLHSGVATQVDGASSNVITANETENELPEDHTEGDSESDSDKEISDNDFNILADAQDIDDLLSDDGFSLSEDEEDDEGLNLDETGDSDGARNENDCGSANSEPVWYEDAFIVADTDIGTTSKTIKNRPSLGVDLTTSGHKYLQELCDEEEEVSEIKDLQDSLKHENLLLTQLTHDIGNDDLNSEVYAEFHSYWRNGWIGQDFELNRSVANGGPPSIFAKIKSGGPTIDMELNKVLRSKVEEDPNIEKLNFH